MGLVGTRRRRRRRGMWFAEAIGGWEMGMRVIYELVLFGPV